MTATSSVWTVAAAGKTLRVRTSSARTALARARRHLRQDPELVELSTEEPAPRPHRPSGQPRHIRRRAALLPEALRRRDAGESVSDIARALKLRRETVRDWLLTAGAP